MNQLPIAADQALFKISMGPNDINDANFTELKNRNLVIVHEDTKAMGVSSESQAQNFLEKMRIGDIFYLCRGNRMILIGRITTDPIEAEIEELGDKGWQQRSYDKLIDATSDAKYEGDTKWWLPNFRSTCVKIPKAEVQMANSLLFEPFFNTRLTVLGDEDINSESTTAPFSDNALNTILYGPPGTGKTFSTIKKALEIIHQRNLKNSRFAWPEEPDSEEGRLILKAEFNRLLISGHIVFTTFHQSLSYEDFIEGIKPKTIDEEIVYEIEDGIFKELCNRARFISGNFNEILERFKKDISEEDGRDPVKIDAPATTFDVKYRGTNVFLVHPRNSVKKDAWYPVNIENIRKAFETDNYEGIYNPTYVREILVYLKRTYGLVKGTTSTAKKDNYVLIIDEINRGNVASIFGELITLLEEDKRENKPESLSVMLPYSKVQFSIPDNLFVIGTMNTADRSVEALDTALRRRFSFENKPPLPYLLKATDDGIDLALLLETINKRLRILKDNDHVIGHAWFWNIKNTEDLQGCFQNKVLPLLKEYFYNDYDSIELVLGNVFLDRLDVAANSFARISDGNSKADQYIMRQIAELKPGSKLSTNDFVSIYS